jgi:pilus assembly protein CpaF
MCGDGSTVVSDNAARDQPSRELAHEFRNLLAVIASYCDLIADETNDFAALKANLLEIRTASERAQALADVLLQVAGGYGPLEPLLRDRTISEIMVNGPGEVFIERRGVLTRSEVSFDDENHLLETIRGLVATTGRHLDRQNPMVEARLSDGSRINAVIRPASVRGPALTIRKFTDTVRSTDDLIREGSLSPAMAAFLQAAVEGRINILVSGATGSGKTTTLNLMARFIPHDQRVITIEDLAELHIDHPNALSLEHRPPNVEGKGELTINQLIRHGVQMRPDRILVGEVRGGRALDVVQAMNDLAGTMSTINANSARDAVARLETMAMTESVDMPIDAVRAQIAAAVNLIVHQVRMPDGGRKIAQIAEIVGYDSKGAILRDIFLLGMGPELRLQYNATGYVPTSLDKAAFYGVHVDQDLFDPVKSRFVPAGSDITMPVAKDQAPSGQAAGTTENTVRQVVVVPFSSGQPAPFATHEIQEEMRKLIDAARSAVDDLTKAGKLTSQPAPKRSKLPKPPDTVN